MRSIRLAALGAVSTVCLLAGPRPIGRVSRVIPDAELLQGGRAAVLSENQPVRSNDRIRTGERGRARITLDDGSIFTLGSATVVTVGEERGQVALRIPYGKLRASTTPRSAGAKPFEIRTSTAVCGVLGTTAFVDVTGGMTHVINMSEAGSGSKIRVMSIYRKIKNAVVLEPRQGTIVEAGKAPIPPHVMPENEIADFIAQTEAGGGQQPAAKPAQPHQH